MILLDKKYKHKNEKIVLIYENAGRFLRGRQKGFDGFKSKIFPIRKQAQEEWITILTPKQKLQGLLIVLAQVKARNISKKILSEIAHIQYYLFQ